MEDQKLIEKCLALDHKAWDQFTKRYYPVVLKCVRYKLRRLGVNSPRDLANDIAQDIFLMLWGTGKLSRVRDTSSIKGWLAIVSINFTSSFVQTKKFENNTRTLSLDAYSDNDSRLSSDFNLRESDKPFLSCGNNGSQAENNDLNEIVGLEISKLVPKQALALKLRLMEGLSHKEISGLLKIPENTVATLLRRGQKRLSKRLRTLMKINT